MWFRSMFDSLNSGFAGAPARSTGHQAGRRRPAVRLHLEALEDRTVPSGLGTGFVQTNLVSDVPNLAQITDPNLKNPWGTAQLADGSFSVANHETSVSTLYSVTAAGVSQEPLTVTVPKTAAGPQGPTGQVANHTTSFLVNGSPASLIFANSNGTISAWNSSAGTTAQVKATTPGAHYTGLDIGSNAAGNFLYAADAKLGKIDVFNGSFALTSLGPNAFQDPQLPSGLTPFNVENIKGELYVSYAPPGRLAANSAPEGVGAVAVFDTSGNFIKQLVSGGKLASPWGMTLAPDNFGEFGGALLVGNFSYAATEINAFDPESGVYLGTLADSSGNTLLKGDNGLWDLTFGTGGNGGMRGTLYFTTGLNHETDGLFGAIRPGTGDDRHGDGEHGDGRPGNPQHDIGQIGDGQYALGSLILPRANSAPDGDLTRESPPAFQGLEVAITQFYPGDPVRLVAPVFALNFGAGSETLPASQGLQQAAGHIPPNPVSPVFFGLSKGARTTSAGPSHDALDQLLADLGDGDALRMF